VLTGRFFRLDSAVHLPVGMRFGIEAL